MPSSQPWRQELGQLLVQPPLQAQHLTVNQRDEMEEKFPAAHEGSAVQLE